MIGGGRHFKNAFHRICDLDLAEFRFKVAPRKGFGRDMYVMWPGIILFGEDAREFVFSAPISPFLFNPTVPMNKIRVGMSDSPNIRSGNVSS